MTLTFTTPKLENTPQKMHVTWRFQTAAQPVTLALRLVN